MQNKSDHLMSVQSALLEYFTELAYFCWLTETSKMEENKQVFLIASFVERLKFVSKAINISINEDSIVNKVVRVL